MKRSLKNPTYSFENNQLKRWLLNIGPARRILLLKKFKENLVCLGLPRLAVRKGLLQLASCPIVDLNRLATTQITRKNRMKGPRSRKRPLDYNNNSTSCMSRDYSPATSASCSRKHTQEVRSNSIEKLDHSSTSSNSSSLGELAGTQKEYHREKRRKSTEWRSTSRSGSKSKTEKERHRKHHSRKLDSGENPNGITWQLIKIDMKRLPEPLHSGPDLSKRETEKKKKKDRLYAKFIEIFGEDVSLSEPEGDIQATTRVQNSDATSSDTETAPKESATISRKSPVFCNVSKRDKKKRYCDRLQGLPKKSTSANNKNCNASNTTVVNNSSDNNPYASTVIGEEVAAAPLPHDIPPITTPTASINPIPPEVLITAGKKPVTAASAIFSDADKSRHLGSRTDCKREQKIDGSTCECNNTPPIIEDAAKSLTETETTQRTESIIIRPEKNLSEPPLTSQVKTKIVPGLRIDGNQEAESTQEAGTTNSNLLKENSPEIPISPFTQACFKREPAEAPLDRFEGFKPHLNKQADSFDDGFKPSSTTDGVSCVNDRLLGALDNICLALHCRRRVDERQQTANKLAIKRNRQEEILKAHNEFESKLIGFREELLYLVSKLETWNAVICYISQGLDHRTASGVRPFSKAEIQQVIIQADVKIPFNISEQQESPEAVPRSQTGGRVICEIDLTEDNREDDEMMDMCDSSTDPPKFSLKFPTFHSKMDLEVESQDVPVTDELSVPSIAEVRTISPQQFDTIEDSKLASPTSEDVHPCFVCSLPSSVACGLCGKANYCSKSCQELDWVHSHHAVCVPSEAVIRFTK